MSEPEAATPRSLAADRAPWAWATGRLSAAATPRLQSALAVIETGRLIVELPSGERVVRAGARAGPDAEMRVNRWRALRRLAIQGDLGFAASYRDGDWSSPDLTALLELAALNGARVKQGASGSLPFRMLNALAHRLRRNTRRGSRRNIEAHYDLGNDFYRLWLDARMIYSSAIFRSASSSLEEAQAAKLRLLIDELHLPGAESILEIGCGWGALAAQIAKASAARVTAITLSPAQIVESQTRLAESGMGDRVELRLQDYRDVEGRFDRIVAIEMIEAVGREYLPDFFTKLRRLLKPGGRCVLQAITIAEDRFDDYSRRPDFIQRHIFPGGFLPSKALMRDLAAIAGLALIPVEHFGQSYALTLREWRRRFLDTWPQIADLGFGPSFRRLWEYYLCYCEAGFRARALDVGVYALTHAADAECRAS